MAYFRKIGNKWSAEIRRNGKSISRRFDNKKLAQQWAYMQEISDDVSKSSKMTLYDAFNKYMREYSEKKKHAHVEIVRIKRIMKWDIMSKRLDDITLQDLNILRDELLLRLSPSSICKELGLIKAVYRVAKYQWEVTNNNPCANLKLPKEPPPRFRRISDDETTRILSALFYHEHKIPNCSRDEVAIAFMLAIETGMRQGEIWKLQWEHINIDEQYLTLYDTKNGDNRDVPLSTRAIELLLKLQKHKNQHATNSYDIDDVNNIDDDDNYVNNRYYAIDDYGRKDKSTNHHQQYVFQSRQDHGALIFRQALKIAGIENLHFHDTRHEAITRLARKVDVLDLARMIGHRDPRSLMIYYNPTATEIAGRLG